ncbi:MAG TPA: pitrilysin family protein [Longimicrobiales bacterium]|nr:pitrilysin family protein [Longimicrobiales bacterium]
MKKTLLLAALMTACSQATPVQQTPPPPPPEQKVEQPVVVEPQAASQTPPELAPPKPITLPGVTERTLANGLRVLIVEHHELPIADFILVVRSGSEMDPSGKEGTASLTAGLLDEGTAGRDALQIADQEAFLGIDLSTSSGWDASRITLHTPTAQLDSALALFADVALRPSFAAKEFERLRKERLTQILQIKDRGPQIADLAFNTILYGENHPYGRWQSGTEASVKGLTRADLQRFYTTYFRPNNSTLIVVGDVSPADIEARLQKQFGNWRKGDVPTPKFPVTPAINTTTVYLIDKPGAPQSSFRIGNVGLSRATSEFFPIQVMNTILGGSFTSRLNQNLRETKGYTYGASSGFSMRQAAGPFTARAEIVAAKSDSALLEFMKEMRSIRDTVPGKELDKAKQYLQLQLPSQFETTTDIAQNLVPIALYNLPLDYFNSYAQNIGAVTQSDVQRVAQLYVSPGKTAIVIVGDRKSIEQALRSLNLGKVEIRDMTGRPILQ